jgi:hypothetical protein
MRALRSTWVTIILNTVARSRLEASTVTSGPIPGGLILTFVSRECELRIWDARSVSDERIASRAMRPSHNNVCSCVVNRADQEFCLKGMACAQAADGSQSTDRTAS